MRCDSAVVSLSGKLLKTGYNLEDEDAEKQKLLKFTVGYSDVPECICFYTAQTCDSQNMALAETIITDKKVKKIKLLYLIQG